MLGVYAQTREIFDSGIATASHHRRCSNLPEFERFRESSRSGPQSWRGGLALLAVSPVFILGNVGPLTPVQQFSPAQIRSSKIPRV